MAADLSDPAIGSAIDSISDPMSPISWLSLGYHATIEKTLVLISTGFDPWVPRWQELIESRKSEPLFGYGVVAKGRPMREGGEKGVVLVYLPEEVTGVRRARAVVHSRALANRFPDYSAIITISHASQITEEFVRDQVNFYNQPVPTPTSSPVKPRTPAQMGIGLGLGRPSAPTPSQGDTASPTLRAIQPSSSSIRSVDRPLPPPPAAPLDLPDIPRLSTPTPPRTVTPPPGLRQSSDSMMQGQHGRKDSLSSRFAKVLPSFTKSNKNEGNGSAPNSPKSPSRFEAFTTGFGTGRKESGHGPSRSGAAEDSFGTGSTSSSGTGGGSKVHSSGNGLTSSLAGPSTQSQATPAVHFEAPRTATPVQPEPNSASARSTAVAQMHPTATSQLPDIPQSQSSTSIASNSTPPPLPPKNGGRDTPPTFNRLHTLGAIIPQTPDGSSRSSSLLPEQHGVPTGSAAFPISPTASAALSTAREKQLDAETRMHEEFRRTEEERTRIRVNSGNRAAGIVRTPTPMMQHGDYDDEEEGLPYDRPDAEEVIEHYAASSVDPASRSRSVEPDAVGLPLHTDSGPSREDGEARRVAEEKSRTDAEAARAREEEERAARAAEAQEQARQLELAKAREIEEQIRRKEEEDERLREEEEQARALHLQREQEASAARKAEEEESALRAKLQAEAEARADALEAEREKANKLEGIREGLNKGKEAGGVMLQGHVTVQTTKSVTWRRRHFQLFPTELRLFKTETDTTPIQTIPLAKGAKISQTYEESQVQGSFKITTAEEDEFFLFTDSAEEKDVLLEGLSMAVWP